MTISIQHFNIFQLAPAEALHAPNVLRHLGLEMVSTQLPGFYKELLRVPAFVEDNIVMHLSGRIQLYGHTTKRFQVTIDPGHMFIVPRGTPSEWQLEESCTLVNLFPHQRLLRQVALEAADVDPDQLELIPRIACLDQTAFVMCQALLQSIQHPAYTTLIGAETLVYSLLIHILRTHSNRIIALRHSDSRLPHHTLRRLLEYIHCHLGQALSLSDLAVVAHCSPYHLARQFRATLGLSLHQYVLAQRVLAARLLIEQRKLPLAAIATQIGFVDQSHLNFHFKRRYGITPGTLLGRNKRPNF